MCLDDEIVFRDSQFRIGHSPQLGVYAAGVLMGGSIMYEMYFEITKEEYEARDAEYLKKLVDGFYVDMTSSDRFLFSEYYAENTTEKSRKYFHMTYGN